MTTTWVHPFEKAGLGVGPFRCVGMTENWYSACQGHKQPGGTCQFCANGIAYEFHIRSADGKTFKVGSDCVMRTGQTAPTKSVGAIPGFKEERAKVARTKREAGRKARAESRMAQWEAERVQRYTEFSKAEPMVCSVLDKLLLEADPENPGDFMVQMAQAVRRFGSLTTGQLAAVKSSLERTAQREADKAASRFVGIVGKRIEGSFEILATKQWERPSFRGFGTELVTWTLLRFEGRDLVTYKGQSLGQRGETFKARFTVKEHEEYNGAQQTKIARPHFPKVEASA